MIIGKDGARYYKLALHIHTTTSDGHKTKSEVIEEYKARGYDAVAFTDHWVVDLGGEREGITVISGCEYNTGVADTMTEGVMHIVGLGMTRVPRLSDSSTRQQIVDGIRSAGGIAVLAHPAWSVNTLADAQELDGIVATEIYNAVSEAHMSMRAYSDEFVDVLANAGLYPVLLATDDAHYYDGSDACRGWVMVRSDSADARSLVGAIARGELFATQGPELYARLEGDKIVVDTTPCAIIATYSNMSWASERVARGENLTHFEYTVKPAEKWVRVEARDADGKRAWSQTFIIEG